MIGDGRTPRLDCSTRTWRARSTPPRQLGPCLAPGLLDPPPGGRIDLRFTHAGDGLVGVITAIEAPRLLEYSWQTVDEDRGSVRWELRGEGNGTRLVLTHTLPESARPFLFLVMPGWQTHLEQLAAFLRGAPTSWSWQRWQGLLDQYASIVDF